MLFHGTLCTLWEHLSFGNVSLFTCPFPPWTLECRNSTFVTAVSPVPVSIAQKGLDKCLLNTQMNVNLKCEEELKMSLTLTM